MAYTETTAETYIHHWQESRCEKTVACTETHTRTRTLRTPRVIVLTLHDQLHHGLAGLHVEAVVLAGLAAVRARHLPGHINNTQHAIVTLHLHAAVRHRRLLVGPRPQDDGLGLP